jgi:hypothetical protein
MKRVICHIKGAGSNIDGIEFHAEDGLMISCEVSDELANNFCRMEGFEAINLVADEPENTEEPPKPKPKAKLK